MRHFICIVSDRAPSLSKLREWVGEGDRLLLLVKPDLMVPDYSKINAAVAAASRDIEGAVKVQDFESAARLKREISEIEATRPAVQHEAGKWIDDALGTELRSRTAIVPMQAPVFPQPFSVSGVLGGLSGIERVLSATAEVNPPLMARTIIPQAALSLAGALAEAVPVILAPKAPQKPVGPVELPDTLNDDEKTIARTLLSGLSDNRTANATGFSASHVTRTRKAAITDAFVGVGRDFDAEWRAAKDARNEEKGKVAKQETANA